LIGAFRTRRVRWPLGARGMTNADKRSRIFRKLLSHGWIATYPGSSCDLVLRLRALIHRYRHKNAGIGHGVVCSRG